MNESLDVTLERATQWLWNRALLFTLVATHFVSDVYNKVAEVAARSVKGALDAHKKSVWLFTARNSVPWVNLGDEFRGAIYPIIYYPETKRMCMSGISTTESESFGDVVLANMSNEYSGVNIEMSSTFHGISWTSTGESPSLYEVALIHCLSQGLVFTEKEMGDFSLEILTADSASVHVRLDSSEAKAPFSGWGAYCADEVKSDSSSTTEYIYSDEEGEEEEDKTKAKAEAKPEEESRPKID
jgi:hypothetical protein